MLRFKLLYLSPIVVVAILIMVHFIVQESQYPESGTIDEGNNPAQSNPPEHFVFGNGDPDDPFEGDQFFNGVNSLGILREVLDENPGHLDDFEFIRDKISDRENFIAQQEAPLTDPQRVWQTLICEAQIVNGATRVAVANYVGKDESENGGISFGSTHNVQEIWRLDSERAPELLDRSLDFFIGLQTHAEAPLPPPPAGGGWMGPEPSDANRGF